MEPSAGSRSRGHRSGQRTSIQPVPVAGDRSFVRLTNHLGQRPHSRRRISVFVPLPGSQCELPLCSPFSFLNSCHQTRAIRALSPLPVIFWTQPLQLFLNIFATIGSVKIRLMQHQPEFKTGIRTRPPRRRSRVRSERSPLAARTHIRPWRRSARHRGSSSAASAPPAGEHGP